MKFINGTAVTNGGAFHLSNYGKETTDQVKNYINFKRISFENNTAGKNGGAVYIESSNLDFVDVDFFNNKA